MLLDQPLDQQALEDLMRQAMSFVKARGMRIAWRSFGDMEHTVCPMSAVALFLGVNREHLRSLGCWYTGFMAGFDGLDGLSSVAALFGADASRYQHGFTLGRTLRDEWQRGHWG